MSVRAAFSAPLAKGPHDDLMRQPNTASALAASASVAPSAVACVAPCVIGQLLQLPRELLYHTAFPPPLVDLSSGPSLPHITGRKIRTGFQLCDA
jgi:hypothetical protein